MSNIEQSLKWMYDRKGKVTYSMTNRRGPSSYDCSSSVYYSLVQGRFFPAGIYIGNTDSLYGDLEKYGWVQVKPDARGYIDAKRGDVGLWGTRGKSGGKDGHTFIFVDSVNIIHCSYGYNGIAISNHDNLNALNGYPPLTIYRYVGAPEAAPATEPVDQIVNPGSWIKFTKTYRVDDVQNIADVWQIRTGVLCPVGFTWADNGIPAAPVVEVDTDGYATPDQKLDVGSLYRIPGKFKVLDVGKSNGRWLAQISWASLKFWIDLETVTEIASSDGGTPAPAQRPKPQPVTTTTTTEAPHAEVPTNTNPPQTTTTTLERPTTTTTTTQSVTTTSTTTLDDISLEDLDIEDSSETTGTVSNEWAIGFWTAFWAGFKEILIEVLHRLQGRK